MRQYSKREESRAGNVPRLWLCASLCAVALVVGGCTTDDVPSPTATAPTGVSSVVPPPPSGKLASSLTALFQQTLDNDGKTYLGLTGQEREVLERAVAAGSISAADYEAVYVTFQQCLTQQGVTKPYSKGVDGVYYPEPIDYSKVSFTRAQHDAAYDSCEPLEYAVRSLFTIQQSNPDLYSDQYEQAVACLRTHGIVPASYTPQQFEQDESAPLNADFSFVFPFDPYDPAANACLNAAGFYYFSINNG